MSEDELPSSEEEWREELSDDAYRVLREAGTEPAFSSDMIDEDRDGVFHCAGCGAELFDSETKFESGTGWPSFWDVRDEDTVALHEDTKLGRTRIEVRCARCDGHLGHVFEDGPDPTGKRYCINAAALEFEPDEDE
ncbi:MAG: peptide-methionine (R)-S-oxide reductase MsrB [Candidatus Nanohaloarchaeota archaeon QJJ-5]|nr:peptide-methionine (R)-S-oxide reductase MsrB [Candidatus Nanohaloarchaeota archaeon QJJ-5]